MPLTRVTITGADDSTSIDEINQLSIEFPFVEWGILISKSQESSPRFPSGKWIDKFCDSLLMDQHISTHMCGKWVRQLLIGELDWAELPRIVNHSQRIQINTHAELHEVSVKMMTQLRAKRDKEFIFQCDGVNDLLAGAAVSYGVNASIIYDKSGGAGILPASWPVPSELIPCGYAGGLGPTNVAAEIKKVQEICEYYFWIDMENNVRTQDNSKLDISAVRSVLEQCVEFISVI